MVHLKQLFHSSHDMNPASSLASLWQRLAVVEAAPAPEPAIVAFELRYGIRLPGDFRSYLATVNGMADVGLMTWDDECIRFWGLPLVDSDYEKDVDCVCPASRAWPQCVQPGAERLFVFADWCLSVSAFAIDAHPHSPHFGTVYRLSDAIPEPIFATFTDFVSAYVTNRDSVIFGCMGEAG